VTWLDWAFLILLLAFTIRGILRGTVAQVFAFMGLFFGIWATCVVAHWVGEHWHGARPAIVYATLQWLVAALAGLAVAGLFEWWGERAGEATHKGPFGWLDRLFGGILGLVLGLGVGAIIAVILLQAPFMRFARPAAGHSVFVRRVVVEGEHLTATQVTLIPGGRWLHGQFVSAAHRLSVLPGASRR
jgi:uncharacterized membrane protein required for colicin V production